MALDQVEYRRADVDCIVACSRSAQPGTTMFGTTSARPCRDLLHYLATDAPRMGMPVVQPTRTFVLLRRLLRCCMASRSLTALGPARCGCLHALTKPRIDQRSESPVRWATWPSKCWMTSAQVRRRDASRMILGIQLFRKERRSPPDAKHHSNDGAQRRGGSTDDATR